MIRPLGGMGCGDNEIAVGPFMEQPYASNWDRPHEASRERQMLEIQQVDHVGIRISDKVRSIAFYQGLGFALVADAGFDQGHPVILRHPSGVTLNLLGPSRDNDQGNILMDVAEKYPGYTHIALRVASLDGTKAFLASQQIEITGSFSFGEMSAVFIRDPDLNVIELDSYGEGGAAASEGAEGYSAHL